MVLLLLVSLLLVAILLRRVHLWYRKDFIPDFSKKRVFITGTDSGFGRRLAIDLDRKGLIVYAGCYTQNGASDLAAAASSRLRVVKLDITDQNSVNAALNTIRNDLPPGEGLWGLVNNAGILAGLCFDFCSLADYEKVMDVNFYGQVRVTEAFLPLVKKARGRVVTVISIFGRGNFMTTPYCCSKYALQPYCDGLRRSMRTFGVHCAIIEPGFFPATGMAGAANLISLHDAEWDRFPEDSKKEYGPLFKDRFYKSLLYTFSKWPFIKHDEQNLRLVTDAMQHGLGAINPKDRYRCGNDAIPYEILTNVLPDWVLDCFARWVASYKDVAAKV